LSLAASVKNQLSGLTYDLAGNVTNDGNGNMPVYDSENRMVSDAGATSSYDADGRRMEKSSGTLYWYGSGGEVLAESNLSGAINEEYVFLNGQRIARVDRPSGTVHYYFSDHLGSSSVITDAVGNVQEQYFYYPYGGLQSSIGSDSNRYKFNGKERDAESGLDNFGARYDSSSLGRFMTPDWSAKPQGVPYAVLDDPQSLNLYGYVRNNPTTFIDADGHCWPQWLCKLGQRFDNAVHHEGFHTNQQVDQFHKARSYLKDMGVSTKGLGFAAVIRTYQTYTKLNSKTGQTYSGRTSGLGTAEQNLALRDRTHHMNEEGYGPAQLDKSSENADAIRGREQQNIEANGGAQSEGGTSGNAINGVSPNNPKAGQYANAAEEEFGTPGQQFLRGAEIEKSNAPSTPDEAAPDPD
jgi:RHS repeat-associated protein